MKTIKITISDQVRCDLDFLREMLEKENIAQVVEALVSSEALKQVQIREECTAFMPAFANLRPARIIVEGC